MYTNEINEKLGDLQSLLEDQGKLLSDIRTKKRFIEDNTKQLVAMQKQASSNTKRINYLMLGIYPLTEIKEEEVEQNVSTNNQP